MKRVYIIDFGDKLKVGVSGNIEERLSNLPVKGERRFYCTDLMENAFEIERKMHSALRGHACKVGNSREYFKFDFDKAVKLLEKLTLESSKPVSLLTNEQKKLILMGAFLPALENMTDYELGYFVGKAEEISKRNQKEYKE